MGGTQAIEYSVEVSKGGEGETGVYRAIDFKDKFIEAPRSDLNTIKAIILNSAKCFSDRPCLGSIIHKQNQPSTIEPISYSNMLKMATNVGSAIVHQGLANYDEQNKLHFVGIFSKNRPEWTLVDVGCLLYKIVTIPIYDTLGDQNITYVLKHTSLTTCFVNDKSVQSLIKTHDFVNLKTLVSFDEIAPQKAQKIQKRGVKIINFKKLLQIGQSNPISYDDPKFKIVPDDCLTFSYTSGTTGPPKGAMLSHKNLTSFCAGINAISHINFQKEDVLISYLPLPHILEREVSYAALSTGAQLVSFSGDMLKLKDDLAIVKPTVFVSVPRLFNKFYDAIKAKFNAIQGWTKSALDHALSVKFKNLQTNGGFTHRIYDRIFFSKTKQALGGRVRLMISGSAPLQPEVHSFLKVVLCAPLLEAYGQTQSSGGCTVTHPYDPHTSQIGGPAPNTQFKLVDIPQMNYTSKDVNEDKLLMPRGQIWLRGPCVFLGYYKDEAKTKETIKNGWLLTGDVGALLPGSKSLKIIDRKKNIFKLQQGQYVAPQKVQAIYLKSESISQVFLTGDSLQIFAVAIATPNKPYVEHMAKKLGINGSYQQLCANQSIRLQVLNELNSLGKKEGLQGFQQAKNIYLEPMGFLAKQIVTNTMKIQRHEGRKVYADVIKQLYAEGMLAAKNQSK